MAKLLITLDGVQVGDFPVDKERITLGRRPGNDILLDHVGVSGEHAVLVTILNDSFVEDLDSTNGTLVNGAPVRKHFLRNGDLIEIGRHRLRFISEVSMSREAADYEKTMVLNRPGMMARPSLTGDVRTATVDRTPMPWGGAEPAPERPLVHAAVTAAQDEHEHDVATVLHAPSDGRLPVLPPELLASLPGNAPAPVADHAVAQETTSPETQPDEPAAEEAQPEAQPTEIAGSAAAAPVRSAESLARLQVLNGTAAGRILEISKPLTTIGRPDDQVAVISRRSDGYYLAQVDGEQPARLNGVALAPHAVALHAHDVLEIAGIKLEFFFQA